MTKNLATVDPAVLSAKRVTDTILSSIALLVTLPISIPALFCIFLTHLCSGYPFAPLFYHETRMSQGKPFELYKFNIFKQKVIDAARSKNEFIHTKRFEKNGGITWIGWLLKQIYMDELPQFYNVLRGDMSIVGPRPVNLEVYDALLARGSNAKCKVPAGITGYFQSYKDSYGMRSEDLDQAYATYLATHAWWCVVFFDIQIMLRTIKVILRAKGI